jgi:hypothetical protein
LLSNYTFVRKIATDIYIFNDLLNLREVETEHSIAILLTAMKKVKGK